MGLGSREIKTRLIFFFFKCEYSAILQDPNYSSQVSSVQVVTTMGSRGLEARVSFSGVHRQVS